MKHPEPQLWAVQVRRESVCLVYVKTADPAEAREVALREADDFVTTETAVAYTPEGRIDERYWHGDGWTYPETELFDEGETK